METHKVKDELVELPEQKKRQGCVDEGDEVTISQLSLSVRNNCDSTILVKKRKPLETKKKIFKIGKRHLGHTQKAKQVGSQKIGKISSLKLKRATMQNFSQKVEDNSVVMERAEEVQANLAADLPSFLKMMQPSHCNRGFFVKLPKDFCNVHLPTYDAAVTLVDESGEQYVVTFLAERLALSGGWRGFCTKNKLLEGDVLVFQLIGPSTFKVYIVRANALAEVDGALGLLNLETNLMRSDLNTMGNHIEDRDSDIPRCTVGPAIDFREVKNFENFAILVNGMTIDFELSNYNRFKYYELCCAQNAFLHDRLLKNINGKLAAEIISEIINITDTIRTCKISTPREEYAVWDRTLEGFEVLGMNVGFIRARLNRLVSLAFESKEAVESSLFSEAKVERTCTKEEVKTLESKLFNLRNEMKSLDAKMEALKANAEKHEHMFQKEVNSPW